MVVDRSVPLSSRTVARVRDGSGSGDVVAVWERWGAELGLHEAAQEFARFPRARRGSQ